MNRTRNSIERSNLNGPCMSHTCDMKYELTGCANSENLEITEEWDLSLDSSFQFHRARSAGQFLPAMAMFSLCTIVQTGVWVSHKFQIFKLRPSSILHGKMFVAFYWPCNLWREYFKFQPGSHPLTSGAYEAEAQPEAASSYAEPGLPDLTQTDTHDVEQLTHSLRIIRERITTAKTIENTLLDRLEQLGASAIRAEIADQDTSSSISTLVSQAFQAELALRQLLILLVHSSTTSGCSWYGTKKTNRSWASAAGCRERMQRAFRCSCIAKSFYRYLEIDEWIL